MKEKRTRGRYKQYLYDPDVKIPISTQNDHKRENNLLLNNKISTVNKSVNQDQEKEKEKTINQQNSSNEFLILTSDSLVEELETIQSESESSDEIEEEKEEDLINDDLKNIIQDKDITRDELAAAFLAAFFNGKITQSSLTDFLQLSIYCWIINFPCRNLFYFQWLKLFHFHWLSNDYECAWALIHVWKLKIFGQVLAFFFDPE